jgi:hypothetical protein
MWYLSIDEDSTAVISDEYIIERMRIRRNELLVASDWTQVADAPVDAAAWAEYRQALRDLPKSAKDPRKVKWPEPPK